MSAIAHVTIVGCGMMGRQVAWASLMSGIRVTLFDSETARAAEAHAEILGWLSGTVDDASLVVATDIERAVAAADLVFENVPEEVEIKRAVHEEIDRLAPPRTIQGSNASSLPGSAFVGAVARRDKFFLMNFNHPRRGERLVEFMPIPETSDETRAAAVAWARQIGMVPLELRREIMGFAQNRIWRAVKKECLHLVDQGYATAADIDRGWMLSYGTDIGPFGRMDAIGLHSVLRVEQRYFEATGDESDRPPSVLVALVEAGHLGVQSGRGFYSYPNPSFRDPDFLQGGPEPDPKAYP